MYAPIRPATAIPNVAEASATLLAPLHAHLFERAAERRGGRGSAGQRHRSGEDAEARIHAQRLRQSHAEHVLQKRPQRPDRQQLDHSHAAAADQFQSRIQSNGRHESDHQQRLQRSIRVEVHDTSVQRERRQRKRHSAGHRDRNIRGDRAAAVCA